ncbi:NERD domain-containing protein [Jatrophihabitans sp. YIM 134969]
MDQLGHVSSRAEKRVAQLLAQVDDRRPECALYSVHLPRHEYKAMSEIDFLVVYDDAVLVIEVKGGRLSRGDGVWTFTDRYGRSNSKREGPFEQARSAMFALRDRLTRQLPALDVAFGYLVVTPDQDLAADLEWDPQLHAGPRAMTVTGLTRTLANARRYWLDKSHRAPSGRAYGDLVRTLRPDFDRVPSLGARAQSLEEDYIRFADRQYELLLAAERNPRIVCTGGAGSGKTLLAVETARRASAEGSQVLVTCRSRPLASLITVALADSGARCLPFDEIGFLDPVDVLVVDEAQDLMDLDSYARLDALVVGGWEQGRWRLFCDVNNQAHVEGHFDRAVFDDLATAATVMDLPFNCRNTSTVVTQTQLTTGADLGVARAGEGPPVEYRLCPDDQTAARELDARLRELRSEDVPAGQIAVVTLRDSIAESAATLSAAFRKGALKAPADAGAGMPTGVAEHGAAQLVTAAGIKGLEATHVCVIDVADTRSPTARARLYVAMTRARISLWVAVNQTAWDQLAAPPEPRTGVTRP